MPRQHQRKNSAHGGSQRQLRVGEAVRHAVADILSHASVHDTDLEAHIITVPEVRVVRATVHKNIGKSMAHRLGHAQLTLRGAGRRILFAVVAGHPEKIRLMSSPATGDLQFRNQNPGDYWMSRPSRNMAMRLKSRTLCKIWTYSERWIVSTR